MCYWRDNSCCNWNENRKSEEKTKQFLTSLKSDLRNDLKAINEVTEEQSMRSKAMADAIELSRNPDLNSRILNDSIKYYEAGRNITFFPTVGSYNAAKNNGLIDYINNEELKRSILNLYEYLYVRVIYNGEIVDERTGYIDWESRRYIDDSMGRLVFDKQALLDDDFIDQLGYLNRFIGFYILRCNNTKSGIEEVLFNIDKYLNSETVEE
ncbi:DUF6090 family protein [Maribacter sp. CXY002]|uniref:DUF6090 family protein n=1 Tax=Maribacter luteocoastalis TaxID=3407671 RepID=UPI003B685F02